MALDLSEDEYGGAVESALAFIEANRGSSGAEGMELLLASVYDSAVPINAMECLGRMDRRGQEIALSLIKGRMQFGRPSASRGELERLYEKAWRKSRALGRLDDNG